MSLDDAIAAASPGSTLAVRAGTYSLTPVTKPLIIQGVCAAEVTVIGPGPFIDVHGVASDDEIRLEGVRLVPRTAAIRATGGPRVSVRRSLIQTPPGVAVLSQGAGRVDLQSTVLLGDETVPTAAPPNVAIWAKDGGHLSLTDVRVSRPRGWGVICAGAGAALDVRGLLIDNTSGDGSQSSGRCLQVAYGGVANLEGLRLSRCTDGALVASEKSSVDVLGVWIEDTAHGSTWLKGGSGVSALSGAKVALRAAFLERSASADAIAQDVGSALDLYDAVVAGPRGGSLPHVGVRAQFGGSVRLERVRVTGAGLGGIEAIGKGAALWGQDVVVDAAGHAAGQAEGEPHGVLVESGATLHLEYSRISASVRSALVIQSGASATVVGLLIDGTLPVEQAKSVAIQLEPGTHLSASGVHLRDNPGTGLAVLNATAELTQLLIEHTASTQSAPGAAGVVIGGETTQVQLDTARVSGALGVAVGVSDGARLVTRDLTVDGTLPIPLESSGQAGTGLLVLGGTFTGDRLVVADAYGPGVLVAPSGRLVARDLLVNGVVGQDAPAAWCLAVDGAATLVGARLTGCRLSALLAMGTSADVKAVGLLVDHTAQHPLAGHGFGLFALDGAHVKLLGARLSRNHFAGVFAQGGGTQVDAVGLLVDGTEPSTIVESWAGAGVIAYEGATIALDSSLLHRNHTAGVLADQDASAIVKNSAILETLPSQTIIEDMVLLADGILGSHARLVHVEDTVLASNARAAVHLHDTEASTIRGCVGTGSLYGLVDKSAVASQADNLWTGNALQDQSVEGLALPDAPKLIDVQDHGLDTLLD